MCVTVIGYLVFAVFFQTKIYLLIPKINEKVEFIKVQIIYIVDQLPRLGKRELICCIPVIMCFLLGEVSSSSGCLGWATLFYCGTP